VGAGVEAAERGRGRAVALVEERAFPLLRWWNGFFFVREVFFYPTGLSSSE
jgi:hypothetical protein